VTSCMYTLFSGSPFTAVMNDYSMPMHLVALKDDNVTTALQKDNLSASFYLSCVQHYTHTHLSLACLEEKGLE
jgi:hypothetical protein